MFHSKRLKYLNASFCLLEYNIESFEKPLKTFQNTLRMTLKTREMGVIQSYL